MNDKEFTIKKNLLDLRHNELLARAVAEMGIAMGFFVSILNSIGKELLFIGIIFSCIVSAFILFDAMKKFSECKDVRLKIINLRKEFA